MQFRGRIAVAARQTREVAMGRSLHLVILAILPLSIVIFIPGFFGWGDALPDGISRGGDRQEAAQMLTDLSKDMAALGLAVLVGVGILLREVQERGASLRFRAASLGALALSLTSIFASIRFRFAIAEQTMRAELMLDTIINRFALQAVALLLSVALLFALTGAALLAKPAATE